MKMDSIKMKNELEQRLKKSNRIFSFDKKNDQLRIEDRHTGKGITISLPGIIAKWELQQEQAIQAVVYYVEEGLQAMEQPLQIDEKYEKKIYPVIRSTSFPTTSNEGAALLYEEHTAETRIYYALDMDKTYRLVDEEMMKKEGWVGERLKEIATFNMRSLSTEWKSDEVAGNTFYFLNSNDGYDASRILNDVFLKEMKRKIVGEMAVAVPHQDVLILADIQNETGYDILAEMTMSFFTSGRVPITALSFLYEEGELEPIFIMGSQKSKK